MREFCVIALIIAAGCVEGTPRYAMSVRALGAPSPPGVARDGVSVAAAAVTRASWKEHRGIVSTINWTESAGASYARGANTAVAGVAPVSTVEEAEVPLVPLPSFEVRVQNHTGRALAFDRVRVELDDGRGRRFAALTDGAEIERRVEAELLMRHPSLSQPVNRETVRFVREAVASLKLITPSLTIPDGGDWQGYVSFDLEARSTEEMRAFMIEARELTLRLSSLGPGAPVELRFPILRKPKDILCSDGTRSPTVAQCANELRTSPADDGPCIQQTRKPRTVAGEQWWMAGTPVANSDLHRTLLQSPVSQAAMRRGLVLRGVGYSLIGAGILATAIAAPVISVKYGSTYGPAATGFAGISLVGLVVALVGVRRSDEAIRLYNEQAEATGLCAPLF